MTEVSSSPPSPPPADSMPVASPPAAAPNGAAAETTTVAATGGAAPSTVDAVPVAGAQCSRHRARRGCKDWMQDSGQTRALLATQVATPTDLRHELSCLCCEKPRRAMRRPPPEGPGRYGSSSQQLRSLLVAQTAPPSDLHAEVVPCLCCEEPAKTRGPGPVHSSGGVGCGSTCWAGGGAGGVGVAALIRPQTAPPVDLLQPSLPTLQCCGEPPEAAAAASFQAALGSTPPRRLRAPPPTAAVAPAAPAALEPHQRPQGRASGPPAGDLPARLGQQASEEVVAPHERRMPIGKGRAPQLQRSSSSTAGTDGRNGRTGQPSSRAGSTTAPSGTRQRSRGRSCEPCSTTRGRARSSSNCAGDAISSRRSAPKMQQVAKAQKQYPLQQFHRPGLELRALPASAWSAPGEVGGAGPFRWPASCGA